MPDWLSVVDRRVRVRSQNAARLLKDSDERVVSLAKGIIRHHHDDRWFHQTVAFLQLSSQFAVELRELVRHIEGAQPGFVGHIVVELLMDANLIAQQPEQLDRYYEIMQNVDAGLIEKVVNRISRHPTDRLEILVPRFVAEKFLYDYGADDKLFRRLNHVMRRIQVPDLPTNVIPWLSTARVRVDQMMAELLDQEHTEPDWATLETELEKS